MGGIMRRKLRITPMAVAAGAVVAVSEWAADPFANNVVPLWNQPDGSTCFSNLLEVGDPVEAMPKPWYTIKVGTVTYHPSDIAGISWFSHDSPSLQQNGLYSYKGYLKTPNTTC